MLDRDFLNMQVLIKVACIFLIILYHLESGFPQRFMLHYIFPLSNEDLPTRPIENPD